MKKTIIYLSLIMVLGACNDENLAELIEVEESSNAIEDAPEGMIKFREELIPKGDYEAMLMNRIDVENADINLTPTNQMESIPSDPKPDIPALLSQIPFLDETSAITLESGIINGGDEQAEGQPYFKIDPNIGRYYIADGTMPGIDLEDAFTEQEWWGKTTPLFKNLGIDEEQIGHRWITDFAIFDTTEKDPKPAKRLLQKLVYAYREINGLPVLGERMIFQFHRTGELKEIGGRWHPIDYKKSTFSSSMTSTDAVLEKIIDHLVELNINPYFEPKITVNTAYVATPLDGGPMYVINPVAAVTIPISKGFENEYTKDQILVQL